MHDQQPTQPIQGPLTIPKAFRRSTGAYNIIVSLTLADLAGLLFWMLVGALIGPPIWWIIRGIVHLLHASLVLDSSLILILLCSGIGRFRRALGMRPQDAWTRPGTLIFLIVAVLLTLWLLKPDWMAAPAPVIPTVPLEALSWQFVFLPQGAAIAAGLSLIAHLCVLHRSRRTDDPLQSFARAHPGGTVWQFLEHTYGWYRHNLSRFHPSPIPHLKTPPTFYYYDHHTQNPDQLPANPEREIYWKAGNLVINRAYIGPKPEQTDILFPFVARLLYDENSPNHFVTSLFQLTAIAEQSWFTAWLLTFPLYLAEHHERRWNAMEREHVLDRDHFAYDCGAGPQLRMWLGQQLRERARNQQPDNAIPTLAERIEHLDSLLKREEQQLQRVRDSLSPGPPSTPS